MASNLSQIQTKVAPTRKELRNLWTSPHKSFKKSRPKKITHYTPLSFLPRRMFPWKCAAMLLRGLVHDASPKEWGTACINLPIASSNGSVSSTTKTPTTKRIAEESEPKENGTVLHQQLARRVSSSERKPWDSTPLVSVPQFSFTIKSARAHKSFDLHITLLGAVFKEVFSFS